VVGRDHQQRAAGQPLQPRQQPADPRVGEGDLAHVPGDVLVRVEAVADVRLVVNDRWVEHLAPRGQPRVVQVHRVVGGGRRVRRVRVQVQHPQEELVVGVLLDEGDRLGRERRGQLPGDCVLLGSLGYLRQVPDSLEDVEALVEAGAGGLVRLELVDDQVAGEPPGHEAVFPKKLRERCELVLEQAPDVVDAVAVGQLARHERGNARRGLGQRRDGVGVPHAAGGDGVDVRGAGNAAVASEVVRPRRVEMDHDHAPDIRCAFRGRTRRGQHRDHHGQGGGGHGDRRRSLPPVAHEGAPWSGSDPPGVLGPLQQGYRRMPGVALPFGWQGQASACPWEAQDKGKPGLALATLAVTAAPDAGPRLTSCCGSPT